MSGLTVAAALSVARASGVDRLDAQLLLARALGRPRPWLIANDDAVLREDQSAAYLKAIERRAAGEPLAYIVGEKEFHGLLLTVSPAVLVPRPDTETLVRWALDLLEGPLSAVPSPQVVDLGTGSGAVALAVCHACRRADVTATDSSAAALRVAHANARRLGLPVRFVAGDWWHAVRGRRFALALSNPPYIAEADPHLPALRHEPQAALRSGRDGLDAIRCIASAAGKHLEAGGWLLLEHGHEQADAVRSILAEAGLVDLQSRADLAGVLRCSGGRCPGPV
ncbi:peptide chain release factor N(5)-glutamine methyltransferase [Piscinibacter sp. XHJ-5]|uniref:peptide chain release factor N(5)-glutamine methyltransferase n=1 Tax=Piscinibacter sp. XHJ-5 TaxID=3037797 RepID=UPI0024530693|nr:peptide chain release factor N(5)-glutamine methyltransferase [Piscinibacter sp. XHJ-5]